ncbi:MAG: hypothetical protein L0Z49_14140 [Actinobacteria bacterium]|nr:hypothetical protein [Actinomycetota bacterium]
MQTNPVTGQVESTVNLQATLSAGSAESGPNLVLPHHPITCTTVLGLEEDGSMFCNHAKTPARDPRTQHCVNGSIALLIIELAKLL